MRRTAVSCAKIEVPPTASTSAHTSQPCLIAPGAGKVRQASVHSAAMISFLRPVASSALRNAMSSQRTD
jgi:hypothetical protein